MAKFTDTITIHVKAGHGGAGAVSFHREKYKPKGGPDGGDGGRGGDVCIVADRRYYNLSHFFKNKIYAAERGVQGMGNNKHGKDGNDLVLNVPPGTQVINSESGELLFDLVEEGRPCIIARGGIGGRGNSHFKSSTNQSPRFAQPGLEGEELVIDLNLKLIADVGLVGLPNAGKSTLLSKLTKARPKIADYPFTTLVPNLGVVERSDGTVYKIADIPGIIEGAHMGHGLGLSFLQHIERVKVILYVIDATESNPSYNLSLLNDELKHYDEILLSRPSCIVMSKVDLIEDGLPDFELDYEGEIIPISSVTGENIDLLLKEIDKLMGEPGVT